MKKILVLLLSLCLLTLCSHTLFANDIKVIDEPDYLSDFEEEELAQKCREFIQYTNMDCVIYIADRPGADLVSLTEDYYDLNGYGVGSDNDGIILCINYGEREFMMSAAGAKAIDTFTDFAKEAYIMAEVEEYLAEGDLYRACSGFVEQSLSVYRNYDYFHQPDDPVEPEPVREKSLMEKLTPALSFGGIGGALASLISYFSKRGQLKSVHEKFTAGNYVTDAKMNMARSGDVYLYTNVLRRKIERNDTGSSRPSSHSSVHTSSSGVKHSNSSVHKF